MFSNFKTWILVTVVLAVIAALVAVFTLQHYVGVVKVAAAVQDIQADQIVSPKDITLVDVPRGAVYQDSVTSQQVVGEAAKGFIPGGTVLRASMFQSGPSTIAGKLSALGNDYVALAISNSLQTTVANAVNPGDHIDVYASPSGQPNEPTATNLLLKNVLVLQGAVVKNSSDQGNQGNQSSQGIIVAVNKNDLKKIMPYMTNNKQSQLVCILDGIGSEGGQ